MTDEEKKDPLADYRDLTIDPNNLSNDLEHQAGRYYHVAKNAAKFDFYYEHYKIQLKKKYADLGAQIRQDAIIEGKKVTEAFIAQEIERNEEYVAMQKALVTLGRQRDDAKELKNGWHMRKDMLIQRCITERAELENLGTVIKAA